MITPLICTDCGKETPSKAWLAGHGMGVHGMTKDEAVAWAAKIAEAAGPAQREGTDGHRAADEGEPEPPRDPEPACGVGAPVRRVPRKRRLPAPATERPAAGERAAGGPVAARLAEVAARLDEIERGRQRRITISDRPADAGLVNGRPAWANTDLVVTGPPCDVKPLSVLEGDA